MNCKPGDLAVIVRSYAGHEWAVGMIVRAVELVGGKNWFIDRPLLHPDGRSIFMQVNDRCLRPIGNPGDDAVDESKAWLPPVPAPSIEPAQLEKAC